METLYQPQFRGPARVSVTSKNNQIAGRTVLLSGSTSVTVSTTAVKSTSLILHTLEANTVANSGFGQAIRVQSMSEGNYFAFAQADGVNHTPGDVTIMWHLLQSQA